MRSTKHIFCEDDICAFGSTQWVIFVANASIVRSGFSCAKVACDRITLGASVVVFVSGLNTRKTRVSNSHGIINVRLCSSLLVPKLVEVDFFAGDLAGFGVIVDLCNLLWFLRPLQIERWHDIFGWNDIFFVISLLRSFGCDLDLLSRFLLPLRSASRRLGGLHIAIGECLN